MSTAEMEVSAELQTSAIPAPVNPGVLMQLPLEQLHESPWNPRKFFPEAKMASLAESMRSGGFQEWNALMARPHPSGYGYEIGAGHRRRRAAEVAGLETVPVFVREMDDAEFLRVLTFDNSNREDPHALDEADGFRFYIRTAKATVAQIAAQVGRSEEYVYQRLKYAELIDEARKAFWDEQITAGHAVLIARLPVAEQKRALKHLKDRQFRESVRELGDWIQRDVHRDVSKAHFDAEDATLVRGASACSVCSKRAGNQPAAADLAPNTCMDPVCFKKKQVAFVQLKTEMHFGLLKVSESCYMNKKPADVLLSGEYTEIKPGAKKCEFAKSAIVVDGAVGKMVTVCADKECPDHRGKRSAGFPTRQAPLSAADRAREEREDLERKIDREVRARIPAAIAAKCSVPFGRREFALLLIERFDNMYGNDAEKILAQCGATADKFDEWLETAPIKSLASLLIHLAAEDNRSDKLPKTFGVDVAAVRKAVAAELKPPKGKEEPKAKPAAKKIPAKKAVAKKKAAKK